MAVRQIMTEDKSRAALIFLIDKRAIQKCLFDILTLIDMLMVL
jgi:hypothetical protein